jgi:uncharacterized protein YbjT (DUF2867 family)
MIVVTGASGNVGRPLVSELVEAGEKVTAVSRRLTAAEVPAGAEIRPADLTRAADLASVFDGADALFLMDTGASAHVISPGAILAAAASAGIGRVVLLSSIGVATRPESPSHGGLMRSFEDAVVRSDLEWTILRPGAFASNAVAWAETVRSQRIVMAPFGNVGVPVIHPADIAGMAAAALRQTGHGGAVYELTGPALVTPRQQAAAIGDVLGTSVGFVEQTREEARRQMLGFMPEAVAETTLDALGSPTPAELRISPDVERVLGRPPRNFTDWVRGNVAAFR